MKITVTCGNTEKTLSFAASELESYLENMLQKEEGAFSVSLDLYEKTDMETDSFTVSTNETGGSITASNPRSVLLGVYNYLHYLGCRFTGYTKETEFIPQISREKLTAQYTKTASFRHRGVCIEGANSVENVLDFISWLPKVGYNSFFLQFKVPSAFLTRWYHHTLNPYAQPEKFDTEDVNRAVKLFEEAMDTRGLLLHKVGHGWTGEVLDEEKVGGWDVSQKPISPAKQRYAAQLNGKRDFFNGVPANTNLCLSFDGTVEEFTQQVVTYAKENPAVDCLHIWLADEYNNVCECEDCSKEAVSDLYVRLLNNIDRRLTEEKLETKLVFLLYQELLWPPVKEKLQNPDRFILMFAPISRTFEESYDLRDIPSEIPQYVRNRVTLPTSLKENLAFLKSWQKRFNGSGFVYDYPLGRAHYGDFGYLHISRIISGDIKKLDEMAMDGYISCQELRSAMPNMLPNYIMGLTLFDKNSDGEAIIEEYFEAAYGKEAAKAKEFLEQLSRLGSCDYVNGKGERVNGDMAQRMGRIAQLCAAFEKEAEQKQNSPWWAVLRCHSGYILRLAQSLEALAKGDNDTAAKLYKEMREYICSKEREYQPYLDVYRVLEVTQKYTGFKALI